MLATGCSAQWRRDRGCPNPGARRDSAVHQLARGEWA